MQEIILTDPFTGIDFKAVRMDDYTILAIHPLTGEQIRMRYIAESNCFMLECERFEHIETISLIDAAKELGVSIQRVSNACKNGRIPFKKLPNGSKMILKKDLNDYAENKKNGRPRKEN